MDIERAAITDELTGLYNRRGFFTIAEQQLEYYKRHNIESVLVFTDLDCLKEINDQYGHLYGDQAIMKFAEIIQKTLRKADISARLGGDEFVFLSDNTNDNNIERLIERLKEAINEFNKTGKAKYTLSTSIGYCDIKQPSDLTLNDIIKIADNELYKNKTKKKKAN